MEQHIRGIKCSLDYYNLVEFLKLLSTKEWSFYVPWCLIDGFNTIKEYTASREDLVCLTEHRVWELELQCISNGATHTKVNDYYEFLCSACSCYLLYFDCGYLEIYVKHHNDFQQFWEYLSTINAEDVLVITDDNDTRTQFSVG